MAEEEDEEEETPEFEAPPLPRQLSEGALDLAEELTSSEFINLRRMSAIKSPREHLGLVGLMVSNKLVRSKLREAFIESYLDLKISMKRMGRQEVIVGLEKMTAPMGTVMVSDREKISRWTRIKRRILGE